MVSSLLRKTHVQKSFFQIYKILYNTFGPQHWWPGTSPFEIMIGAILTQNTSWYNVGKAIENIKKARLLDPQKLLHHHKKIPTLIKPAGFYKVKSKRLIAFLKYYVHKYNGHIGQMKPKKLSVLRDELLHIKGIGFETADSIILYAISRPIFVVDTYTRRIFSRHHFIDYNIPYDDIRILFESHVPRRVKLYNEYHALLVKLGKERCKKNEPLCDSCPLQYLYHTS